MNYFELDASSVGRGAGWKMINYNTLQSDAPGLNPKIPWPDGHRVLSRGPWTLPAYVEAPHFVIDLKTGHAPRDIEVIDGFLFISRKFKAVFESLAPGACEFRSCTTEYLNGAPGPETWLCSVTGAFKEAVDIDNSVIRVSALGLYMSTAVNRNYKFRQEVIMDAHIFTLAETPKLLYCDENFKAETRNSEIKGAIFKLFGKS